jgi:hypothetical protein
MKAIAVDGPSGNLYATSRVDLFGGGFTSQVLVFDGASGELDCELKGTGAAPNETFNFGIGGALAIDQANGDLYVFDIRHLVIDQFETGEGPCPTYSGRTLPEPIPPWSAKFDELYVDISTDSPCLGGPERDEPCDTGTYDSPNAVEDPDSGRTSGEVYATTGTNTSNSHLYAFRPRTGGAPGVEGQAASGVGEREAVLEAKVKPNGFVTAYHFEYTAEADEGYEDVISVPVPDASAGEGGAFVKVSQPIVGLAPDTTYRFRIVASNCGAEEADPEDCLTIGEGEPGGEGEDASFTTYPAAAAQTCANATLRSGAATNLADCRAYELVTPPDTNGRIPTMGLLGISEARIGFATRPASPDGQSLVFGTSSGSLPGIGGGGNEDAYEALRDAASGWQSRFVGLSGAQAGEPRIGGFTPAHDYAFWSVKGGRGTLGSAATFSNYLRVPAGVKRRPECAPEGEPEGRFEWIGCGTLGVEPRAQGEWIGPGGDHVVFESRYLNGAAGLQLEECAPPTGESAVYDRAPGEPTRCVSLLPGDITPTTGATYKGASADGSGPST